MDLLSENRITSDNTVQKYDWSWVKSIKKFGMEIFSRYSPIFRNLIVVILLAFLVFIFIIGLPRHDKYLESLKPILLDILKNAGYHTTHNNLPLRLRKSRHRTYTLNKHTIYVVSEKPSGETYNRDTLLFVILHEISHILSPDEHHTKTFYQIEKRLHQSATQLGYIRKNLLDKSYPCSH